MSERLLGREFSSPSEEAAHYRQLAYRDHKTGLGSEHLLEEWEEYEYRPTERTYLFAFIDIEKFKYFNDTYGQDAGDGLIGEFGKSLNRLYRASRSDIDNLSIERADPSARDIIVRTGGDEVQIIYDLDHLVGDDLFKAIDAIQRRLSSYRLVDPVTVESFAVRAVFELSVPEHPVEYCDIKRSLSDQMVALKDYQKARATAQALGAVASPFVQGKLFELDK